MKILNLNRCRKGWVFVTLVITLPVMGRAQSNSSAIDSAANTSQAFSTGRNYFGIDLGMSYNWYWGQSNFFWPNTEGQYLPISNYASFGSLGSGVGFLLGIKGAIPLSNSVDLEGKLRCLTNYTSSQQIDSASLRYGFYNSVHTQVTNVYNLSLRNLDLDFLLHIALDRTWYAAGGLSFSTMLSNQLFVVQTATGSGNYYAGNDDTDFITPKSEQHNFFASTRADLIVGGGVVFPLGGGSTLLDAELLLNIPLTNWLQSGGEDSLNRAAADNGFPAITFPNLWYVSLTIGMRFPFGGNGSASGSTLNETSQDEFDINSHGKSESTVALIGHVTDSKNGLPVDANIVVVDLTNNEVVTTSKADSTGRYNVRVPAPGKYSVTADANGYEFRSSYSYFEVDTEGRILAKHSDIELSKASY
jgi:hypothetical protein